MIVARLPAAGGDCDAGAAAAVSRRRPDPELPRGLRLPAAGLDDRAGACRTCTTLSERARGWALTAGFAFTVQALFFAPHVDAVSVLPVLMRRHPCRLPRCRCCSTAWLFALRSGPPLSLGFLRAPDRRQTGARRRADRSEAGHPRRLQRPLFASLRDHRADPRHAVRQCRRRGRHRARLSVRALAPLLHPGDIVYLPLEEGAVLRAARRIPLGPGRRDHVAPRLAHARRLPPERWLGRCSPPICAARS